jgi:F0F1-type ATP synthase membrane subunit b/b'
MADIFGSSLLTAGLIDLDASLLVQLAIFGTFALALNFLVVKPMIASLDARYAKMEGARRDAEAMDLRAARALSEYEENMSRVRSEAIAAKDTLRNDAQAAQRRRVTEAQQTQATSEELTLSALRNASDEARVEANKQAGDLSDVIVSRLIGPREA